MKINQSAALLGWSRAVLAMLCASLCSEQEKTVEIISSSRCIIIVIIILIVGFAGKSFADL